MASSTSSNLYSDGKQIASNMREKISDTADDVRENLQRMSQNARDTASDKMDDLRESGRQRAQQLEGVIQDDPLKAILIAAGIGFVCGILLRK